MEGRYIMSPNRRPSSAGARVIARNGLDTLKVRMLYLGPPSDGRRCEVRFEIPKSLLKKLEKRER
jgi:hypothetical protein